MIVERVCGCKLVFVEAGSDKFTPVEKVKAAVADAAESAATSSSASAALAA